MKCSNKSCDKEIGAKLYCPLCGYANKQITLQHNDFDINGNESVGELTIWLENDRFHPVNAKVSLADSLNIFSFNETLDEIEHCIQPSEKKAINVQYNMPQGFSDNELSFSIELESDDGFADGGFKRPREIKNYWRTTTFQLTAKIVEPGKLSFDKGIYNFGFDGRVAPIRLTHIAGLSDIVIESIRAAKVPERFKIIPKASVGNLEGLTMKKGEALEFDLHYEGLFSQNLEDELEICYSSGATSFSDRVSLFVIKKSTIWAGDITQSIPEYIVAIDFGTSKTTAGYITVDDIFKESEGTFQFPDVEIVKFGNISNEGFSDIPSVIGIRGNDYVIGRIADAAPELLRVNYLKMNLQNDNIVFKSTFYKEEKKIEKSETRETLKVLTAYLSELKKYFPEEIKDADEQKSVLYVFTLPVLDNEIEGAPRYRKQESVMREAAALADYGDKNGGTTNIKTLPESEAALLYILNSQLRGDFKLPRGKSLENGDVIGVFDYGAGTLDISFGRYTLSDGIPSIDPLGSIGLFGANDTEAVGGNTLNENLAIALINELLKSDKEQDLTHPSVKLLLNGEELVADKITEFDEFAEDSPVYPSEPSSYFISSYVRRAKEFSAFLPDAEKAIGMDNVNPYARLNPSPPHDSSQMTCYFDTFKNVVDSDINNVIETIKKALSERDISNIKYMFTLGGSSLIKHISNDISDGLRDKGIRGVFSPYDYSGLEIKTSDASALDDRQKLRDVAVSAVVKGAALSLVTKMDKVFQFGITVRKEDASLVFVDYEKGTPLPHRPYTERYFPDTANGNWVVCIVLESGKKVIVERFLVEEITQQYVKLEADVIGREFILSFKVGESDAIKDLSTGATKRITMLV